MGKYSKRLYKYCKLFIEFKKELEDLALDQLDSEELSNVVGGKKTTTALAASLVSVLSIASPYISANNGLPIQKQATAKSTAKKPTAPKLGTTRPATTKSAAAAKLEAINAIRAKNHDDLDNKACKLMAQLLTSSFDICARYYLETSPENQRKINTIINENGYREIGSGVKRLETLSKICRAIIGIVPNSKYQPAYGKIRDLISKDRRITKDKNGNIIIDNNVIILVGGIIDSPYGKLINDPLKIYEWYLMTDHSFAEKVIADEAFQQSMNRLEAAVNKLQTQLSSNPSTQPTRENNESPDDRLCRFVAQLFANLFNHCVIKCNDASIDEKKTIYSKLIFSGRFGFGNTPIKINSIENADYIVSVVAGHSFPSCTEGMDYDKIKQFVNSGNIKELNGEFIIDLETCKQLDALKSNTESTAYHMMCLQCLSGRDELINRVMNNLHLKKSVEKLQNSVNSLKKEAGNTLRQQQNLSQPIPPVQPPSLSSGISPQYAPPVSYPQQPQKAFNCAQTTQQLIQKQQSDAATILKTTFVDCEKHLFNAFREFMDVIGKKIRFREEKDVLWQIYEGLYKDVENQVSEIDSLIKKVSSESLCKLSFYQQIKNRLDLLKKQLTTDDCIEICKSKLYAKSKNKNNPVIILPPDDYALCPIIDMLYKCRVDVAACECAIKLANIPNSKNYYDTLWGVIDSEKNFIQNHVSNYNLQRALSYFHQRYELFQLFCVNEGIDVSILPAELPWPLG